MHHRRGSRPFAATPPVYPFPDRRCRDRFLHLVREHLGQGGKNVVIEHGVARVEGDPMVHGLANLAQVCHQSPADAWPGIVDDIADSGFDQLKGQLAVRIHPEEILAGPQRQHLVFRTDLPGTVTVLVFDLPGSTMAVPLPIAESWGIAVDALFATALQNLAKQSEARWMSLPLPPDGKTTIDALNGDFHASSHVLRTDACLPRTGVHGNLIGLPVRGALLSHPIDSLPMQAIEAMLMISTGMFRDGPGSITPHLYWRTPAGQFLRQQGSSERGRVRFAPSPEFAELMVMLQRARPRPGE